MITSCSTKVGLSLVNFQTCLGFIFAQGALIFYFSKAISLHILCHFACVLQLNYCNAVVTKLSADGIRAEVCHGERLPKLIRIAEKQKVPLMAVVGPKEVESGAVTVRSRFSGELGTMAIDDFISRIQFAVENRSSL